MHNVEALPQNRDIESKVQRGFAIFRYVHGPAIRSVVSRIRPLNDPAKGVEIPTDRFGLIDLRVDLIKDREVRQNKEAFIANRLSKSAVREALDGVDSLSQAISATITDYKLDTCRKGHHYLNLLFDSESEAADNLYDERISVWQHLEDKAGEELVWKPYVPDIRLAFFEKGVSKKGIAHFENFVSRQLPIEVELPAVIKQQQRQAA